MCLKLQKFNYHKFNKTSKGADVEMNLFQDITKDNDMMVTDSYFFVSKVVLDQMTGLPGASGYVSADVNLSTSLSNVLCMVYSTQSSHASIPRLCLLKSNACRVKLLCSFLSVCPIHSYLLILILISIVSSEMNSL